MTGAGGAASLTDEVGRWLAAAMMASGLAACNIMASGPIDFAAGPGPDELPACASALGSYSLPRAYLRIQVGLATGTINAAAVPDILVANAGDPAVQILRHPDPSLVFCIDYLASALSHDVITVKKTTGTSFLGAVMINATDQSVYVIESLLRAGFILGTGSGSFTVARSSLLGAAPQILADLEYDPFNPEESSEVNATLSKLGFCLILEDYTFDRRRVGVDKYCDSPLRYGAQPVFVTKAYMKAEATPADPHWAGLLYRPRIPYRLEIYHKADPTGSGHWQLYETDTVSLENLAPVLSLDIQRAAFTNRTANFVFDSGTLTIACVSKGSELLGFSDIPLQIAKSIVAVPAAMVSVQVDQMTTQTSLLQAQQQLVQVQNAYFAALAGKTYQADSSVKPVNTAAPAFSTLPTATDIPKGSGFDTTIGYGTDLLNNSGSLLSVCTNGK